MIFCLNGEFYVVHTGSVSLPVLVQCFGDVTLLRSYTFWSSDDAIAERRLQNVWRGGSEAEECLAGRGDGLERAGEIGRMQLHSASYRMSGDVEDAARSAFMDASTLSRPEPMKL